MKKVLKILLTIVVILASVPLTPYIEVGAVGVSAKPIAVSAGFDHTLILKDDQTVWAVGGNEKYQLGNGTNVNSSTPVQAVKGDGSPLYATAIAAGSSSSLALDSNGNVWRWGQVLGSAGSYKTKPEMLNFPEKIIAISSTGNVGLVIGESNKVYVWGDNSSFQQGNGNNNPYNHQFEPKEVKLKDGQSLLAKEIEAGQNQSIVIGLDDKVWFWGAIARWQVEGKSSFWPEKVLDVNNHEITATDVTSSNRGFSLLKQNGEVWTVGENSFGELGDGSDPNTITTKAVKTTIENVEQIDSGYAHTIAMKSDGSVWAWGDNTLSPLGDLTDVNRNVPVQVLNEDGSLYKAASTISAGGGFFMDSAFSVSIKNGSLVTWGGNNSGELGIDTSTVIKDYAEKNHTEPMPVTVTFNANEGNGDSSSSIAYNATVARPADPVKTGYTFAGWFTSPNANPNGGGGFVFTTKVKNDTTLYAIWKPLNYKVTFNTNGGSTIEALENIVPNTTVPAPKAPERESFKFLGWYMDAGLTQSFEFTTAITGDLTLYAKWEELKYTMTFDTNGGSTIEALENIVHKATVTAPKAPEREGFKFLGWYTDAGLTKSFEFTTAITGDLTLYAKWDQLKYTITFEVNEGSAISAVENVLHNATVTAPENPKRQGYKFSGWYTDKELTKLFDFKSAITSDVVLYAKWTKISPPGPTSPIEEVFYVDVVDDSKPDELLVKTPIKRTRENGVVKDQVTFTADKAQESVDKLVNKENKISRIVIPDIQDEVSETTINVPKESITALTAGETSLSIDLAYTRIFVPNESLNTFADNLYFRVIPVKKEQEKIAIETRAKQEKAVIEIVGIANAKVEILGRPMTIETNMQSRPVTLTLPLPENATQEQIENLAVFIEHSNGTKEVVRGRIVNYKGDIKGVEFDINHFSTFTILYLEGAGAYFDKQDGNNGKKNVHIPYIRGYEDNTFRPNAWVTRQQMAAMLARQLSKNNIPVAKEYTYKDTGKAWAKNDIEYVRERGIMTGYTPNEFGPSNHITRAQMAAIAIRWIDKQCVDNKGEALYCQPTGNQMKFKDVSDNLWAADEIARISQIGIMTGFEDGYFRPQDKLTRAQAVKVLNRLFNRGPITETIEEKFTDVSKEHWPYYEIQEASIEHKYTISDSVELIKK
ncbi:MAG: InlB B-repeat-containing protein [Lysinibacillus sp.]